MYYQTEPFNLQWEGILAKLGSEAIHNQKYTHDSII